MTKRPNIVIFNPDQMRADALGHLGNPAAHTPFLDAFAAREAVSFSNAYCQNPVCVPSRCSFFTGLYPHVRGHRTMQHLLRPGESSLFSELKDAGYYVWMNARNDLVAGQYPGLMERHATEIYYGGCRPKEPGLENPSPRGGPGDKNYYSHYEGRLQLDETGRHYTADDEDVDAAIRRILNPADDRPLCLFLGLMYPHPPYQAEEPYFSAIDRTRLPRRIRAQECSGKPKMEELIRRNMAMEEYTEQDWDELRACYLAMCMKVDEQFRRLCQALKDAGIYDDTAIFFFSDHGDYTGDYDLPEKSQNTFEDCLVRVPLLVKPPKDCPVDPGVTGSMAELVDFYAIAMDFAGVEPGQDQFGRSLRPILADRSTPGREYVFCEGGRLPGETQCDEFHAVSSGTPADKARPYWPRQQAQTDGEAHAKATMIRDERYKYIRRQAGGDEFYDLLEDPGERINRVEDSAYRQQITAMRLAMLDWYQATCDVVPRDYDARFTPEMMWAKVRPECPPDRQEEMRQRLRDGVPMFEIVRQCREMSKKSMRDFHTGPPKTGGL